MRRLFRHAPPLLLAACLPASAPAPPPDLLLITVDTLRPDHLGLYGYARDTTPRLERWFGDGLRFTRSYATEANTSPSVVSLLSGLYPQDHGVRLLYQLVPDELALLPDHLPPAYQTAAFVSNVVLTDEATGLASRFDHYDDFVADREPLRLVWERNAAKTTDAALAWLTTARDPARPSFLWVHYIDPHGPYRAPDDRPRAFEHEGVVPIELARVQQYLLEPGVGDALEYVDRYDEEIAYLDLHVGRLLEGWERTVDAERAFALFTADHGESMLEHERWFTHGYHVYEEIVRVPLAIRGPAVPDAVSDRLASGIDVAPTLLARAGAAAPEGWPGVDLLAPGGPPEGRTLFAEATQHRRQIRAAIAPGGQKWVAWVRGGSREVLSVQRFHLANDPGELDPRTAEGAEAPALAELRRRIAADPDPAGVPADLRQGVRLDAPKIAPRADAEARERLRALGYVE